MWSRTCNGIGDAALSGKFVEQWRRLRWRVTRSPGRAAIGRQVEANLTSIACAALPIRRVGSQERLLFLQSVHCDVALGYVTRNRYTSSHRPMRGAVMRGPYLRLTIHQV